MQTGDTVHSFANLYKTLFVQCPTPNSNKQCIFQHLQLSSDKLGPGLSAERLWTLDWSTDSTVNDELRKHTNSSTYTEKNCVE